MISFYFFSIIVTTIVCATYYKTLVKFGDGIPQDEFNEVHSN